VGTCRNTGSRNSIMWVFVELQLAETVICGYPSWYR